MKTNEARSMLCYIMENIAEFEFRTPDALRLKQEMRQWYYGGRDGGEADRLVKQFHILFSGNAALDAAGELLWSLADASPLEPGSPLSGAMSRIPRPQIVGRSIRAYGITASGIQYRFAEWQTDAESRVNEALEHISQHLQYERTWRRENRMSLPSAAVSLAGIASLAMGVWFLFPYVRFLLASRSIYDVVMGFPSSWRWSPGTSLAFLVLFTLAVGDLLLLLRRMAMTLCAGLFWTLYHRGRYMLRCRRLNQFRAAMRAEGFGEYGKELQSAVQQLADLPPDAPQNRDPSRALLGRAGMDKVFQRVSLRPVSRGWSCKPFYKKVESCHIRSRAWIVILIAALVILRDLMFTGPITAFLQKLI